jgi:hypothetical protein
MSFEIYKKYNGRRDEKVGLEMRWKALMLSIICVKRSKSWTDSVNILKMWVEIEKIV